MRIIGGRHKGLRLMPPGDLPVRPTTDMAKEALFNILQNRLEFEGLRALDLFSGTGGITLELASRGAASVVSVDRHTKCVHFVKESARKLDLLSIEAIRADVFSYLLRPQGPYDFIFADPPYDLDRLTQIPKIIQANKLLHPEGLLVLEFSATRKLPEDPKVLEIRKYGNSSFAFYKF